MSSKERSTSSLDRSTTACHYDCVPHDTTNKHLMPDIMRYLP